VDATALRGDLKGYVWKLKDKSVDKNRGAGKCEKKLRRECGAVLKKSFELRLGDCWQRYHEYEESERKDQCTEPFCIK